MPDSNLTHALLIFGLTFVLEDVAVLGAALLVVNSMVSLSWAAGSSFAGIWLGDIGLYVLALRLGRPMLERSWFKRLLGKVDLRRSETWFQHHGSLAILLSRAIPGTRLPTYLAAGLLKVPASRFLSLTAGACLVWVAVLFAVSFHIGMMVISGFEMLKSEAAKLAACALLAAILAWPLRGARLQKILRWEFWPPVLFYVPVAAKYVILPVKYHSFSLPAISNPGMHTGGLIGESKYETLRELASGHPEFVAETYLVPFHSVEQQLASIHQIRHERNLEFPLVFKPDVGQRGFGFKLIHSEEEARRYVNRFSRDVLMQRYVPGPHEAGIFYYRFPNEATGKIFGITEKVFPSLTGDGRRTVAELIRGDARASNMTGVYLERFAKEAERVPAAGETLRLVEAGNHCQGAIFLDGAHLFSDELASVIDEISRSVPGFFVGRYDIRYASEDSLRKGRNFKIIELNGASSEATNIYDPRHSLVEAYRTLFRQWEIIFAIAHQNRMRGLRPVSCKVILANWARYRRGLAHSSVSD